MRRTLKNLLYASVAVFLALLATSVEARDLPNLDLLALSPKQSRAKAAKAAPASVQRVTYDEHLGIATFVWLDPERQAARSRLKSGMPDAAKLARDELKSVAGIYGVSNAEVDAAPLLSHQTLSNGASLVRLGNQRDGVPVFREQASVLLNAQGVALNIGGFLGGTALVAKAKSAKVATLKSIVLAAQVALQDFEFPPSVGALLYEPKTLTAVDTSSGYRWLALPDSTRGARGATLTSPIRFREVWFRMPEGLVAAVYLELRVLEAGELNAYSYVVASDDQRLLFRNDLRSQESVVNPSFAYSAWANPQTGVPYPGLQGLDLNPFPGAGPDGYSPRLESAPRLSPSSNPWVDASVNPRVRFTYGNNVRAWADVTSPGSYGGSVITDVHMCGSNAQVPVADFYACTASNDFQFGYDLAVDANRNTGQASAAVTNLFYTLNWLHDWFYEAGFDEASGNAQASNFGLGGVEGDPIDARTSLYLVRNNASMETPADGASPILNMYVYDAGGGPTRSAALDNTIVAHEWGHYLTKRLIGNANGLTTRLAAGLGEGWGDFVALLLTVTEQDKAKPGNERYQGAYAHAVFANAGKAYPQTDWNNVAYFGSRRYPYSTDMSKNPLTFKHIQDGESLPDNVPRNPHLIEAQQGVVQGNAEIHNVGEVWASMLWECYASLLNTREFGEAQRRMRNYLVTGLKLTPNNPTFTEARDALLAGIAANDSQDYAACLGAFAKRGAGPDAKAPDRNSVDLRGVNESYNAGALLTVADMLLSMSDESARRCDADGILDNGETAILTLNLVNRGDREISGVVLAMQSSHPGMTFPKGNTLALDATIFPGKSLPVWMPVHLSGSNAFANASIEVSIHSTDQLAAVRGQSIPVWVNADIEVASSLSDAVDVWPGGMNLDGSMWGIGGADGNHWYQLGLPNDRVIAPLYSPELKVSETEDLIITFDQEYDFGSASTNGGQLFVSLPHSLDTALADSLVPYTGQIWWVRGDQSNTNLLRNQFAFTGKTNGWMRDVTVNLGRQYAGQTLRFGWRAGTADKGNPDGSQFWRIDNIRLSGVTNRPFASIRSSQKDCSDQTVQNATLARQNMAEVHPTPIPTMSPLGLCFMALLLAGLGWRLIPQNKAARKP